MIFYATAGQSELTTYWPDTPTLLPASSYFRKGGFNRRPCLPERVRVRAADCGGFVATRIWGDYKYTPEQYVAWLHKWSPQWAATMDYCCEREIAAGIVEERQKRTTEMAVHFWRQFREVPWTWVPTVQGWHAHEYVAHAQNEDFRRVIEDMRAAKLPEWRVGIGTLCARKDVRVVQEIVWRVAEELPGVPLHLWGIKQDVLGVHLPDTVVSVDSGCWQGLIGRNCRAQRRAQAQAAGKSRLRYTIEDHLPMYVKQLDALFARPKQMEMFR